MTIRDFAACLIACLAIVVFAVPASAQNIAWISLHPADDTPSTNALDAGFTSAPDIGYTDLLTANGYNVTRHVTLDPESAAAEDLDNLRNALNSSHLAIVSRSTPSGHFQSAADREFWHGITAPMIFMSGYGIRDNRLQFMAGNTIPDTSTDTDGPVTLTATVPDHPIFEGVGLDDMNSMHFADAATTPFDPFTIQRGISVVTDQVTRGGQLLATVGAADNDGDPEGEANSVGGALIAHFPAGEMLGVNTLAGDRMIFLSGSREHDGLTADGSGIFDLTDDGSVIPLSAGEVSNLSHQGSGARLFLNSVAFMAIPEPTTATISLLALAGLGLLRRPRK